MEHNISRPTHDDKQPEDAHTDYRDKNFQKVSRVATQSLTEIMSELAEDADRYDLEGVGQGLDGFAQARAEAAKRVTPEQWQAHIKKWFKPTAG